MNRIQFLVEDEFDALSFAPWAHKQVVEPPRDLDGFHRIFTPLHYERNYAYPLVVWLHGEDDDERQVTKVMPLVSDRNYVAVGPRGTVAARQPALGYRWPQQPDDIELAEQRVMSAIAAARNWLNVAPHRIFLAGYAEGGTMAFRLALRQPRMFAGVLSFGGPFPETLHPLAELSEARRMKIFLADGLESQRYPQSDVCRHLRVFHAAGMTVCLRLYRCGDELTTSMLSDMDRWIMEQVAPRRAPRSEPSPRSRGK
jgi:phospholipase/carboxylesterase